jgi:hypothetical protein
MSFSNVEYEHVERDCVSADFEGEAYSYICR